MSEPSDFTDITNIPDWNAFIKGIDISHYQKTLLQDDWDAIKAKGIEFIYLKASQGSDVADPLANINANNAAQNGLKIGFYHYGTPSGSGSSAISDGEAEAANANKVLGTLPSADLPFMLDWEINDKNLSKADFLAWTQAFLNKLAELTNSNDILIYSRTNILNANLPSNHNLGSYKFWVSRYNEDYNVVAGNIPNGWTDWYIWQFTSSGSINGKNFDLDIMRKS